MDYYRILQVPRDATTEQIKRNYQKLTQIHRDSSSSLENLRIAYQTLSAPLFREEYDKNLAKQIIPSHSSKNSSGPLVRSSSLVDIFNAPFKLLQECYQDPSKCSNVQTYGYSRSITSNGQKTKVREEKRRNDKRVYKEYDIVNGQKIIRRLDGDTSLLANSEQTRSASIPKIQDYYPNQPTRYTKDQALLRHKLEKLKRHRARIDNKIDRIEKLLKSN